ncbi:hypothetical protein LN650_13150 [Klebsiella pneumoniae subsp. pneumoniae]|nr:hypothetical protein [Klebsiella pneumoniae subsp. pneumoniae]
MSEFDLTRILTGSGRDAGVYNTEARLDITRLPKVAVWSTSNMTPSTLRCAMRPYGRSESPVGGDRRF